MTLKELKRELEADMRNKLSLPSTVLSAVMAKENVTTEHIEKALKSINEIPLLIEKWFRKFEESNKRG